MPLVLAALACLVTHPVDRSVASTPWTPALLRQPVRWTDRMNDPVVSATTEGLRVEIGAGRKWGIVAIPGVRLSAPAVRVRVRVRSASPGARWLMRLYGDIRGDGRTTTTGMFEAERGAGEWIDEPDPRMTAGARKGPVQLQLGLEGEPGDHVTFDSLTIDPRPAAPAAPAVSGQIRIRAVDWMPAIPRPLRVIDWAARARAFDRLAFDLHARGEYLPLAWLDRSRINADVDVVALPSYVGDPRTGHTAHESITTMGAVLSAMLVGVDPRRGDHDRVAMCAAYFGRRTGEGAVLNLQEGRSGGSFWYDLWPQIVFNAIADRSRDPHLLKLARSSVDRWVAAVDAMTGPDGRADMDHVGFSLTSMKPTDNGQWREPDAAAAIGWLAATAYARWKDPKYLRTARTCFGFLERQTRNPFYEVLLPWGAQAAARMNAELGTNWDLRRLMEWSFGPSDCRGGWAVTLGRWGGIDCAGLVGSIDNRGGYAFAMNTFAQAGALVPVARYEPRYARALGRWMLNLASSARLFYADQLPAAQQTNAEWTGDPGAAIAYEGLRARWAGHALVATGDPVANNWGPKTDRGLYGSAYSGMLGAIVGRTDDPAVLSLDCLATDFMRAPAYPTRLIYNPRSISRTVRMGFGGGRRDLYDAVSHRFVARGVGATARITVAADRAVVLVACPAGGRASRRGRTLLVDGVAVDYWSGASSAGGGSSAVGARRSITASP